MTTINVLIVDDNPIVVDRIQKRLAKANEWFLKDAAVSIRPFHCAFLISNLPVAGQAIENCILDNSINFLLLDRGFFDITDPCGVPEESLDKNYLFISKGQKSGLKGACSNCFSTSK